MKRKNANGHMLRNWMKFIPDHTKISDLAIPGAYAAASMLEGCARATKFQTYSIEELLNFGVRCLDLSFTHIEDAFLIYQNGVYQKIGFNDIMLSCNKFLKKNASELLIIVLREDDNVLGNTRSFEETFYSYIQPYASYWDINNTLPTVGEVRGKVKLLRGFAATKQLGLSIMPWQPNSGSVIDMPKVTITLQDELLFSGTNKHAHKTSKPLNTAYDKNSILYLNYTNGCSIASCETSVKMESSIKINYFPQNHHSNEKPGHYGVILAYFMNAMLSSKIISSNFIQQTPTI